LRVQGSDPLSMLLSISLAALFIYSLKKQNLQ